MSAAATSPSDLRARAADIVGAFQRRAEILTAADAADAADVQKLESARVRLRQHEAACDPDRLDDFQLAAAMTAQLVALESKATKDKSARRTAANRDAEAAIAGIDFLGFFRDALALERERVTAGLSPFFVEPARAAQFGNQTDAVGSLVRWCSLVGEVPSEAIVARLRAFASGAVPVWKI
jgi:hypothetical protein